MKRVRLVSLMTGNPAAMEGYFEKMEARGLRLDGLGSWLAYFEKSTPRAMRYRLEYFHLDEGDYDRIWLYADCGWEHVDSIGADIHIFRAPADTGLPELHTDPAIEAESYRFAVRLAARKCFALAVFCLVLIVLSAATGMYRCLLLGHDAPFPYLLYMLGTMLLTVVYGVMYAQARRRYAALMRGVPPGRRGARLAYWFGVVGSVVTFVMMIAVFQVNFVGDSIDESQQETRATAIADSGAPFFTLDALARDDATPEDVQYQTNRSALRRYLPLARLQYDWESGAHWSEEHSEAEQARFRGLLVIHYVQLRRGVPEELALRWMLAESALTAADRQTEPGFDAYYARAIDGDAHEIVAQNGDQFVWIEYYGAAADRLHALTAQAFGKREGTP